MQVEAQQSQSHWDDRLQHVAISDVGLRRSNNQDSMSVVLAPSPEYWQERGHLFVVADGMGAHAAGELASKLAADNIPHAYLKLSKESPPAALVHAIEDINDEIHNRGRTNSDFQGMGTTTSVLLLVPQGALVAHVGDSRVYRLRRNQVFEQLSFDHSLVWELEARQPHNMPAQVPKNIITRSLGPAPEVQVDLEGPFPIEEGDVFLLCSDGLSGQVDDEEMGALLSAMPIHEATRALVDLANLRGGPDNITVIVVRVVRPMVAPNSNEKLPPVEVTRVTKPIEPPGPEGFVALGVGTLFTLVTLGLQLWLFTAIGIAVTLGVGSFFFRNQLFGSSSGSMVRPLVGGRYGKAPYRQYQCPVNKQLIDKLTATCAELRQAATTGDWTVDWYEFNRHCEQAKQHAEAQQFAPAARALCLAISFMMGELRNQRRRKEPQA